MGNLHEARIAFVSSNPAISEPVPDQPEGTAKVYPSDVCSDENIGEYLGRRFDQTVLPGPLESGFHHLQAEGSMRPADGFLGPDAPLTPGTAMKAPGSRRLQFSCARGRCGLADPAAWPIAGSCEAPAP